MSMSAAAHNLRSILARLRFLVSGDVCYMYIHVYVSCIYIGSVVDRAVIHMFDYVRDCLDDDDNVITDKCVFGSV